MPQIKESNYLPAEKTRKAQTRHLIIKTAEKVKTLKESRVNDIWQKNNGNDHRFISRNHKFHKAATLL